MQLLSNAIEKAGTDDPESIIRVLHTEKIDTPMENIGFDRRGDIDGAGFTIYKVVNGKFVDLWK
ncbi:MAG: hypothetical protein JEY99_18440 [Spirochaetales bacterium]|nr:hypothetical protein [Spirochaetales bacterium]